MCSIFSLYTTFCMHDCCSTPLSLSCLCAASNASAIVKETAEDEAVNKIVEKAAVDAAARTAQGDDSPQVEMQDGQQQFAAAPGVASKKAEEPVTTEASIVAPAVGGRIGDRVVDPKNTKKSTPGKVSQVVRTNLWFSVSCVCASYRFLPVDGENIY